MNEYLQEHLPTTYLLQKKQSLHCINNQQRLTRYSAGTIFFSEINSLCAHSENKLSLHQISFKPVEPFTRIIVYREDENMTHLIQKNVKQFTNLDF